MITTGSADPAVMASIASISNYMSYMAPQFMSPLMSYGALIIAFVFVIVVFI
jgi:hypothetical protein